MAMTHNGQPSAPSPLKSAVRLSVSGDALSAAVADVLAALKGPFKFGLWGLAIYGVLPTEIAKDDPNMMSKIMTSLPADTVTESPVSSLPLDQATVSVTKRVTDIVKDERQHIAVVAGLPMSVPVVDAKPTKRPGVFSVSVPGLPDLNVSVTKGTPVAKTPPKGLSAEKGDLRPAGFTAGGNSREAVIRFPKESGQKPVYVSVTDVLTPAQVKQRQEEEKRRQQEWDARHPVEVAEREYDKAKAELDAENRNVNARQAELDSLKNKPEYQTLVDPENHNYSQSYKGRYGDEVTATVKNKQELDLVMGEKGGDALATHIISTTDFLGEEVTDARLHDKIGSLFTATWAIRRELTRVRDDVDAKTQQLNIALESRKPREKKTKDAENKLNEEKKKNKEKVPELKFERKIRGQMEGRGWTEQDIQNAVAKGKKGRAVDQRKPKNTDDGLGRNDPATVYGESGKYVVVNDRTGEVTQVSDKTDPNWVDDSRIQWGK